MVASHRQAFHFPHHLYLRHLTFHRTTSPSHPAEQLFKDVVRMYDEKNYKKAIKALDQILKKFPSHAATLAYKGLTLGMMGHSQQGYDLVKQGIKSDIK